MFAQIVVRFPGIFRRIDLMAQLLQLNFEVVTQQGIILMWSWRELNPRPKFLHPRHYMLSQSLHSLASCGQTRH